MGGAWVTKSHLTSGASVRPQNTQRATEVKKFVGFSLKPLCCRDPALLHTRMYTCIYEGVLDLYMVGHFLVENHVVLVRRLQ